ncbi:MAG: hypothetical protein M3M98_01675, partial [Nitrospirota bacterium]|nr:hypothetical protein [Nitrospirota bacterium]
MMRERCGRAFQPPAEVTMPRLLLLLPTHTYRADAFIEAARHIGISVTVGMKRDTESSPDSSSESLWLDVRDPQAAAQTTVEFSRQYPIDAVIGVNDVTAVTAAAVAEAVGLPHNSVASVTAAGNKRLMRELLSRQGLPVPHHAVFPLDGDSKTFAQQVGYPCVLKPLILSASCGVIRANDEKEFTQAFGRVGALLTALSLAATD